MDYLPEFRFERTLEILSTTDNEAAVGALLESLDGAEPRWQAGIFRALVSRRGGAANSEILRRWETLAPHHKETAARRHGWMSDAIRAALASADEKIFHQACAAAHDTHDYSQIPELVNVVLQGRPAALADPAIKTVLRLAERLHDELAAARDYRVRRDVRQWRTHAQASLERALQCYEQHRRRELIEALLVVADCKSGVLSRVLRDPSHRGFVPLMEALTTSPRHGALSLLLSYLDDSLAPLSALHAVSRRRDVTFLRLLCRKIGAQPSPTVRSNLRRIEALAWIRQQPELIGALSAEEQMGAVQLAYLSSIPRPQAFEVVSYVLSHGNPAGRRSAALALAGFTGPDADAAVQRALLDDDPHVQAAAARQLRPRQLPDAVETLIGLLESPHAVVREAASVSLSDITFDRYLDAFDGWNDEMRLAEGLLVMQVDPKLAGRLVQELQSSSRSRQRRALEITSLLGLAPQVEATLVELAGDEDQYTRLEAIRLLGTLRTPLATEVVRAAINDKSLLVQEAARRSWDEMSPQAMDDEGRSISQADTLPASALADLRSSFTA
jgi:hypothetical protein